MNFFNIDMHISIIHDIKTIFTNLGHNVTSKNLSQHTWINNEKTSKLPLLKKDKWKSINQDMCDKFYKKYRDEFEKYDAFVHSYPPAFALLFEKFEKPIITIACTRLDFPCYPQNYDWLLAGLQRLSKQGQLVSISNNLLDKYYCEDQLDFEWEHISSLCSYMTEKYSGDLPKFLLWTRSKIGNDLSRNLDQKFSISKVYDRNTLVNNKGIVHLPYNLSIMSAFEQYYQNIPLLFPSLEFQWELYTNRSDMLTEITFSETALTFEKKQLSLADWYDEENFKGVEFFHSFEDLEEKLINHDFMYNSQVMAKHNIKRESDVYSAWNRVLERIK